MNYTHVVKGIFLDRPNRFLARVLTDGGEAVCHVKNTGRLRELLIPGSEVVLEYHPDAEALERKTSHSLIGIYKEHAGFADERLLVNIDSQAPNLAAFEWLGGQAADRGITAVRREVTYGSSRFDLAFVKNGIPGFMEVKGVTLESGGSAMFPDAPTERGVKHVQELAAAAGEGYLACLLFVIQMKGIRAFTPNRKTHAAFADALTAARSAGVHILARDCVVTEHSMRIDRAVEVIL